MRAKLGLALLLGWMMTSAGGAQQAPAPRELVQDAIAAHGGERLLKANVMIRTGKGTITAIGQGVTFTSAWKMKLPDQWRVESEVMRNNQKSLAILVLSGDKGWRSTGGAAKELTKLEIATSREDAYLDWLCTLFPLLDEKTTLTAVAGVKVNDEDTLGVKASRKDRPDITLYFDKKSKLLVKTAHKGMVGGTETLKESIFSDHREFQGIKMPTRLQFNVEGQKSAEWTFNDYRFPGELEGKLFVMP